MSAFFALVGMNIVWTPMNAEDVSEPFGTGQTTVSGIAFSASLAFHGPVIHQAESPPV